MRHLGVVLAAVALAACGADGPVGSTSAPLVCDGSATVRLAIVVGGGGPLEPGRVVQSENGWSSLIVTGMCDAWVLPAAEQPLRTLRLSDARAKALSDALALSTWPRLAQRSPGDTGCADAPGYSYRFGELRFPSYPCGLPANDPLAVLARSFSDEVTKLTAEGAPVDGDVRYLLIDWPDAVTAGGAGIRWAEWPLSLDPTTVAVTQEQSFGDLRGKSQKVSGADATALRKLRADLLAHVVGSSTGGTFVPVIAPGSHHYQLYLRDASPFEGADGLIPAGVF